MAKVAQEYILLKNGLFKDDKPKKSREQVDKEFAQCGESLRNDSPSETKD